MSDVLWYLVLAVGAWRAFTLTLEARKLHNPIEQARQAAKAFGIAGAVAWFFMVLGEAEQNYLFTNPSVMGILGTIGAGVIFGAIILVPMWTPRLLLRRDPISETRRTAILVIGRIVAVFAALCILVSPFLLGFSSSVGQFFETLLGVALPLGVFIMIANTMVTLVRRLGPS